MIIFLTRQQATDLPVRVPVHQLLELKIPFIGWQEQRLPDKIPADLEKYDALLIDDAILREAAEEDRKRLEDYARCKYVHIIPASYNKEHPFVCEQVCEVAFNMFAAEAHLEPQEIPPLPDHVILSGFIERAEEFWNQKISIINEYHLHYLEGALALENTFFAPRCWSEKIDCALEQIFLRLSPHGTHDQLCGASLMKLYADRSGRRDVIKKFSRIMDQVAKIRPRTPEGFLSMGGDISDPLFFKGMDTPFFGCSSFTIEGRDLVTNELFHFYGGIFAAYAAAGHPDYLQEAVRIMDHLDRIHRDKDGLLFHASRNGEAIGEKWGRGNTHALLGAFYMLKRHPEMPGAVRRKILCFLDKTGRALQKVQAPSGLWHNVLNHPETPEETSCSVIITYIYSWCVNRGLLSRTFYWPMLMKARMALKRKFWHGFGSGNCIGSFPAYKNPNYYYSRRIHCYVMPLIAPALIESGRLEKNVSDDGEYFP